MGLGYPGAIGAWHLVNIMTNVVHIEPHLRHDPCPAISQPVLLESGFFGEALLLVRLPSFCGPGRVHVWFEGAEPNFAF